MPKVIDNYVLQDKIGSGQFGDVFKGFHQQNKMEVAIKTIKRQTIKGKFYQLLQNQIKVLKTCDNPYIMKLYALKRTANHYYLILEYCNGGDMLGKLKKYKRIQENQVIKYFCQILTGFQTLVKHKIMHRDFKLANILLHDDNIKIADFGFSKLLNTEDYTTTMLGSPLNMAPEVLGGNKYNNKADIWSIGACIYQMLVGKPPYMANNMVDLLKNINTKPLAFPNDLKINSVLIDVLKKMLVPDVKKRISWNDLFAHPINRYLDNQIRKQIDLELIDDQSLMLNTSKFYLKTNLVITKPQDIEQKEKINNQLMGIIKTGEKSKLYQVNEEDEKLTQKSSIEQKFQQTPSQTKKQQTSSKKWKKSQDPAISNISYIFRKNSKRLLHYRNIYAFLATVVDQIIQLNQEKSQLASFILIKKIVKMIQWLLQVLNSDLPKIEGLDQWSSYKKQNQYNQVKQYILREQNVFSVFCQGLQSTVKEKIIKGQLGIQAKEIIMNQDLIETYYRNSLLNYIKPLIKKITGQTLFTKDFSIYARQWKHIQKVLICINYKQQFQKNIDNSKSTLFDFNNFYEENQNYTPQQILLKIEKQLISLV